MSSTTRVISSLSLFAFTAGLYGCAGVCLQTPVSDKVSNARIESCAMEADTNLDRRDIFDRYVRLRWARGEYQQIVILCRRILAQDKDRTDAMFYLAVGLRKLGKCRQALTHYRSYADRRPSDGDPHFGMALCYERLGRRGDALAAYKTYIKQEKRPDKRSWRQKARARVAALSDGAALARTTPARVAPPAATPRPTPTPKPVAVRPVVKPTPTKTPKPAAVAPAPVAASCATHEAAIKKDPFDTKAYDGYASCALARKDYAAVMRRMRVAIRDNPEWAKGWLHLGIAYKALGQAGRAKSAFAKACSAGVPGSCNR
jgi:tetratricopeptide (TPR) repeat protein